jgi:hypothetical protein
MSPLLKRLLPAVALVILGLGLWLWMRPEPPRPPPRVAANPTSTASVVTRFPTGRGDVTLLPGASNAPQLPPPEEEPGKKPPCDGNCFCGANADPCASKRQCASGGCADNLAKQSWKLRLGGLRLNGSSEPDGEIRVCVRRSGQREESCASLREARGPTCSGGARLPVTTEQLLDPGLDIDIYDAQGQKLASSQGAAYKFLTSREMCTGVRFGGSKFTGKTRVELLWFYLDD